MATEEQEFSNPLAPDHGSKQETQDDTITNANLTNADFRKMLMTPGPNSKLGAKAKAGLSTLGQLEKDKQKEKDKKIREKKKKKGEYLEWKKSVTEREKELADKYRDRAVERREEQKSFDIAAYNQNNQYAPNAADIASLAERRKQSIQESKFLGGDMEHTHLVKGLDFALLQKMREEIVKTDLQETTKQEAMENLKEKQGKEEKNREEGMTFNTKLGQAVYRTLFVHKHPERNEHFAQNRMAYLVELDDEYNETDVPTTLIRSKADTKAAVEKRTLTNNDIVINKLTQILSYLRQGNRYGKQKSKKKDKGRKFEAKAPSGAAVGPSVPEDDIYGNVGEYVAPGLESRTGKRQEKPKSYFEGGEEEKQRSTSDVFKTRKVNEKSTVDDGRMRLDQQQDDSYMECYPGAMEEAGATYDSDEDADYTKMDMGNKKGPLTRWDFEDEEKYNKYMEGREAMPKAAFQFGVKMTDGRKTKRHKPVDEKQKLDREMQRINQIINKRRAVGTGETPVPEKVPKRGAQY